MSMHKGDISVVHSKLHHTTVLRTWYRMFFDKGGNANVQGGKYGNALQAASSKGHESVVWTLLDDCADVNAEGGFFGTALQAAAFEGHDAVMLLHNGADVNSKGNSFALRLE
jgi:hypothetical protein